VARVCAGNGQGWSPQQVAEGSSWKTRDGALHVSHETIYTWFYFCRRAN